MGKKLIAILAFVVALFVFASCTTEVKLSDDGSASTVTSNGGFLVETGNYVYFINGSEYYSEDNTYGNVSKGALVRMEKSSIGKANARAEVVVPKLISTGDHTAGIYIYGGKIYYATPNATKSKTGNVQNSDIVFCSANVNGSGVKEIYTATGTAGNSMPFRITEANGKIYIVYVGDETVDGTTTNFIYVIDENGKVVAKEEYSAFVFEDGDGDIYFTKSVENEVLDQTESFNAVYRLAVGESEAKQILYGAGSARNAQDGKTYANKGIQGVTFTLVAAANKTLYFSVTNIDTSVSTNTYYAYLSEGSIEADAEKNFEKVTKMTYNGSSAVFAEKSIFESPNKIVYIDSSKGLCAYNYEYDGDYNEYNGVSVLFYSKDILSATISHVADGYLYYQISGVYYRIPYAAGTVAEGAQQTKLTPVAFSTSWYAPEIVKNAAGKEYVVGTLSSADFYDYVFALPFVTEEEEEQKVADTDVKAFLEGSMADEEELAEVLDGLKNTDYKTYITTTGRYNDLYMWQKSISFISNEEMDNINTYILNTYTSETTSSSSEKSGCSSAAGMGAAIGAAFVALAGALVAKKRNA